jgi:hypothetical protein
MSATMVHNRKKLDNNQQILTFWESYPNTFSLDTFLPISKNSNVGWRKELIKTWKIEKSNHWIKLTKTTNVFTNKNKTILHGRGLYYLPVRCQKRYIVYIYSKFTYPGYNRGIHYWEVIPTNCEYRAYTNIGACNKTLIIHIFSDVTQVCTFSFFSYFQMLGVSKATKGSCLIETNLLQTLPKLLTILTEWDCLNMDAR